MSAKNYALHKYESVKHKAVPRVCITGGNIEHYAQSHVIKRNWINVYLLIEGNKHLRQNSSDDVVATS